MITSSGEAPYHGPTMPSTPHTVVLQSLLKALLAATALFPAHWGVAQSRSLGEYEIIVTGLVLGEITGDPMKGALVLVRRDGLSQEMVVADAAGRYELALERGSLYDIAYTATGQVPKRVTISTKGAPAKLDVPVLTMTVDISLFALIKDYPVKLFDQPLGKAQYDGKAKNFIWDEAYGKQMRNSIRLCMARYDAQLEKQEAVAGR